MRHAPDPEDPTRCLATDLLVTDCSGCRGSDESFVDALLGTEREPVADYGEVEPIEVPDHLNPLDGKNRGLHNRKWWLDTGPTTELVADSHPFKSSYRGSQCKARCGEEIRTGQQIVHVNVGGYAHVKCLEKEGDS